MSLARLTPVRGALLFLFLLALAAQARAAVQLPSRFVPGDTTIAGAVNDQSAPFVVQGGAVVLVVWSDNRANSTGGYEGETSRDIYGMRFDATGVPLDAVPFAIAAGPASQEAPRAAWNGTSWLVAYESYDLAGTGYYYQKSLEAVRVSAAGVVLDAKPTKIVNHTPVGLTWAVASDGVGWVIVNQTTSTSTDLVASRVSAAGVLVDRAPRSIVPGTYYLRGGVHLAYAGGVYLLAYEESMTGSDPVNAIRFDSQLAPLDAAPFGLAPAPLARLASNGTAMYAVWVQQQPDYTVGVMGSRIDTAGRRLDGSGVKISGANDPQPYATTSVTWDGAAWRVTWGSTAGVRVARVSATGQVLDPGGVAVAGPQPGPTASAGNGSVQMAWTTTAGTTNDVLTSNVSAAFVSGPTRTASSGAPSQTEVDVSANASGFLAIYRSSTSAQVRIVAQPLDAAGTPLTAQPVEVTSGTSGSAPGGAAAAWNGTVHLVTWVGTGGAYARRIRGDGTPVDATPFLVLPAAVGTTDVEALGGDFLVAGLACSNYCQIVYPIVARVRGSDGAVLDSTPKALSGIYSSSPRIATLGGRWLVAYRNNMSHDDSLAVTDAAFVDASGTVSATFLVHGYYSTAGGNGIFSLGLASSGSVALLVQSQELTSGVETDLLARVIQPDGTVGPYVNLTPWEGNQYRPRVAWDGTRFVVVFQDQKTRLAEWGVEQLDARSDLVGMRVGVTGTPIDPQGFVISNSPFAEAYPNVSTLNGAVLVAGSVMRNVSPLANYRIGYELLGTGGNAWPVAAAAAAPGGGDAPISIAFSSTGTFDPDGVPAAYRWDFGDGATSTASSATHVYSAGGPFVATLTVTDDRGASTTQQVLVRVLAPNAPPVAVATANRLSGPAPLDVVFSAAGSYDPDGFVGNIEWAFGDGSVYWGATAYNTFYQPGTWPVTLTVHDGRGGTGTTTLTVTVGAAPPPPAPSGLTATPFTTDWINLTWNDNSATETGFSIERCAGTATWCSANPASFVQISVTGVNINYHADTGLPAGTTYTYRVRAFNGAGSSGYSNTATAATLTLVPAAPSSLTGRGGTATRKATTAYIDLSWLDNASNETGFVIERCRGTACTGFTQRAAPGANVTAFRDTGLPRRTTFRYRIKAVNANGSSGWSNVASVTTP